MFHRTTKRADQFLLKQFCLLCILVACSSVVRAQEVSVITVNGRVLSGTNSAAQMRGGRLFLPVGAIARVLGDNLQADTVARTVSVRRQTGVTADFNAETNQVLENGAVILVVPGSNDLVFPPNVEELMMPAEIVAALLDVSIRRDQSGSIIITRGGGSPDTVRSGAKHRNWELFQLEYDYNFNRYSSLTDHGLTLRGTGRIGSGRFTFLTNSVTGSPGTRLIGLQSGNFTVELPTGQNFVAGDFGTGTDLEFISSTVRGGAVSLPYRNVRLNVFMGRAISGSVVDPLTTDEFDARSLRSQFRYDTNIVGGSVTTGSDLQPRTSHNFTLAAGAMRFAGPDREGNVVSGSVRYGSERSRFQVDLAGGEFSGNRRDGRDVTGSGVALNTSGSIRLFPELLLQARYTYINQNFLSPQKGLHEPLNLKAASVTWQPKSWLTAGFSGSTASRPGKDDFNRFWSATLNVSPDNRIPSIFFSHTQSDTRHLKNSAFTLISATKQFNRARIFLNVTRLKTLDLTTFTGLVGGSFRVNESNTLDVNQSFGSRGVVSGMANWQTTGLFYKHLSLGGGLGYMRSGTSSLRLTEHLSASLRLPRQSTMQFSFVQTQVGPTMLLTLRGLLLSSRSADRSINGPVAEVDAYGAVYGRVYQDINLDGKFDPGVDLPQANVKVRVDGNRYVVSDASGNYHIDSILKGEHSVYLDLLSVRADLTLLDGAQQQILLDSKRDSIVDFRLVRTGRVSGVVWLDTNENGLLDKDEQPLPDVRVVTGSGRDTLTDANGYFLIGDLPPGEHVILLDQKTLPEQKKSATGTLTIKILAGSETETTFPVVSIPVNVKKFSRN
jgi:hypothetical protein